MKYVILGGAGQLGMELAAILPGKVWAASHAQLDLAAPRKLFDALDEYEPDVILNCAAYNKVDDAELESSAAFNINCWAVKRLAHYANANRCRLVHFSTDHVFSGRGPHVPYKPTDAPGPLNIYGLSKIAGEYALRSCCSNYLIIRTCGLYGLHGKSGKMNFANTVLRLAADSELPMSVISDQWCTPTYTLDLANRVAAMLTRTNEGWATESGLYHVTNSGACSWYEFALSLLHLAGLSRSIRAVTTQNWRQLHAGIAPRPLYSVLEDGDHRATRLPILRHWRAALAAFVAQRQAHNNKEEQKGEQGDNTNAERADHSNCV